MAASAVHPLHKTWFDDPYKGRRVGMLGPELDFQLHGIDAVGTHIGTERDIWVEAGQGEVPCVEIV